jgi:hypothetical protein
VNQFEKRVPPESKSEFWEINFSIFMEKLEDIWTSLVRPYEIFLTNGYFVLIVQSHFRSHVQLADAILTTVYDNRLPGDERRIVTCKK